MSNELSRWTDARIAEQQAICAKATEGEWHMPHMSLDGQGCQCQSILGARYCGAIADMCVGNGLKVSEGGNDCPPKPEAIANAAFIVAAHNDGYPSALAALREAKAALQAIADECPAPSTPYGRCVVGIANKVLGKDTP